MFVKWRDKSYPAPILDQFDPTGFKRTPDGIRYTSKGFFDIQNAATILLSFLDISGSSATCGERHTEIVHTIKEAGANNKVNPGFFLSDLKRRLLRLEARPFSKYVVIGKISLAKPLCGPTYRCVNGVRIAIGVNISLYRPHRELVALHDTILHETPSTYFSIKTDLLARSDEHALSKSHDALSLLLGFWNHTLTFCRPKYTFSGRIGPIAEIVLAPLRSLHKQTGEALDCWQYDPDFTQYPRPLSDTDKWIFVQKAEVSTRKKLASHCHRDFLEDCIRAYFAACSYHSSANAFLSLWSLLERLTGTDKGDAIIRRVLLPIAGKYHDICLWELKHLHHCRNCLVHRGESRSDQERLTYKLKTYVDIVLRWWLFECAKVVDKQEVFDLLDTPRDTKRIRQRMKILKHALRYTNMGRS